MARFLLGEDISVLTHRCVELLDDNPRGGPGMLQSIWPPADFIKHCVGNLKKKKKVI